MKSWYWFGGIVVLVAVGIGVAMVVGSRMDHDAASLPQARSIPGEESTTTSAGPVEFTADLFDVERVKHITPLGELNGGYIETQPLQGVMVQMKGEHGVMPEPMAIYAPADMTLERYAHYTFDGEPPEWSLTFRFSDALTMTLHHVTDVVPEIAQAITDTPAVDDSSDQAPSTRVAFAAGEQIGSTTGTSQAHNWNIYMHDTTVTNRFANPDRFIAESAQFGRTSEYLTATCPFDYYPDTLRQSYIALLGATAPGQTTDCGSPSSDVVGTLAGLWFLDESGLEPRFDGAYGTPFSIYKDSAGRITLYQIDHEEFTLIESNPTYKDPAEVTSQHCYQLTSRQNSQPQGYAYFQVVSDSQLQLAYSASGTCPSTFPTDAAMTYYR